MHGPQLDEIGFLVVDDNQFMRSLIKTVLKAFRVNKVWEADDGASAFKLMAAGVNPDIILTNWNMPTLDGVEFTRLVRTADDSPNPFVPIIMITAHTERTHVAAARDSGINDFLAKPLSAKALYNRIVSVIERPRPFVKAKYYFGPDRRRKAVKAYQGPERRKTTLTEVSIG